MSFVILGHCCKDGSCLRVCPQNCIGPTPGDPDFAAAEQLSIDPSACIGCSACVDACPVAAIKPEAALTDTERVYARQTGGSRDELPGARRTGRPEIPIALDAGRGPLRIAVVGAGTAAMYTVRELLQRSSAVRVTVFERGARAGGLLRTAVSPDHRGIGQLTRLFDVPFADSRVESRFGTRVGVDVTIEALRDRFDAVILAFGATTPRTVAGAAMPDVHQAIDLVAAANAVARDGGIPAVTVTGPVVAIAGGGNVALDVVANIARRRIVDRSGAPIARVVVLARSPVSRPSFTFSALHELRQLDVDITVDTGGDRLGAASAPLDQLLTELARPDRRSRRSGLPVEVIFGRTVTGVRPGAGCLCVETERTGSGGAGQGARAAELPDSGNAGQFATVVDLHGSGGAGAGVMTEVTADSVVLASGFTCEPVLGVPLGPDGAVSNREGRVVDIATGVPIAGLYVVGWAKRGGRGGLGENRRCAAQTVDMIAADLAAVPSTR